MSPPNHSLTYRAMGFCLVAYGDKSLDYMGTDNKTVNQIWP